MDIVRRQRRCQFVPGGRPLRVRIRRSAAIIVGMYSGTARRPFPTLGTPFGRGRRPRRPARPQWGRRDADCHVGLRPPRNDSGGRRMVPFRRKISVAAGHTAHPLSQQADSSPMLRTGEPCFPFRRGCGGCPTMYRGTVMTVPYNRKKSPDSGESGDFPYKLFVPIRRASERRGRRSLRSEFHTQSGN